MSQNEKTEQEVKRLSQHTAHSLEKHGPHQTGSRSIGHWQCLLLSCLFLRRWHCVEMMNERNIPAN